MPPRSSKRLGRPPTIRDVAERADVHPSVVSRVVSQDAGLRVRDETRARVQRAVEDLGYVPSAVARGLRIARTGSIALIIPSVANPAYAQIVEGAQQRAAEIGVDVLVGPVSRDRQGELSSLGHLLQRGRVDGMLVAVARLTDPEVKTLESAHLPIVLVNRRSRATMPYVVADEHRAAVLGTEYLLELGHRRIVHMAGDLGIDTWASRRDGFLEAMASAGLKRGRRKLVDEGGITEQEGFDAVQRVLAVDDPPTALFFGDTRAALGALAGATAAGVAIPDDVSIIGFPDNPYAPYSVPSLSVVHVPLEEMGYEAMVTLERLIAGEEVEPTVLDTAPTVIARASTGPPRS